MNQNESRKAGLLRLSHLREVTEAKGEEMAEERPRFHRLAREDNAPRVVSSFNLFQTPLELARLAVEMAQPSGRILEPSAGLGRLYTALREVTGDSVELVEVSADCCGELYRMTEYDSSVAIHQRDFLEFTPEDHGKFDSIVMNPPFKMGTDIKHIEHALTFLADGGRLVSFCYWGVKQRKRFADCDVTVLPAGSFQSEGTRADVAIVSIQN